MNTNMTGFRWLSNIVAFLSFGRMSKHKQGLILANHHILLFSEKKMVSMSQEELMRYMADETDKTNKEGQDMNRILTS